MYRLFIALMTYIGRQIIYVLKTHFNVPSVIKKFRIFTNIILRRLIVGTKLWLKIINRNAFAAGFVFCVIGVLAPYQLLHWYKELPSMKLLKEQAIPKPTQILDRSGSLLYEIYIDTKYTPVELSKIPDFAIKATLAVEDANFYNHNGIQLKSIVRAAYESLVKNNLQGGSTITQQLVKNTLITKERTLSRKLKEAVLALKIEQKYSKDSIMEMYLNSIPYGGSAWGIESAAQKYFGKDIWDLNQSEISMLAGLPTSPSLLSPLSDLGKAKERQKYVLDRMVSLKYIAQTEAEEIYNREIVFAEQKEYIRAPHFVAYIRNQLEQMYGKKFVDYGGLKIVTTLDLNLQEKVSDIVRSEIAKSEKLDISNGAALVSNVDNSEILAYVGSVDYFKEGWGSYDVIQSLRQPGSSIKPVTYSAALSRGFTAATVINDSPVRYKITGSADYAPVNYDGRYHGNVTVRQALANSYNIPAVKVASKVGVDNIVETGKDLGLSTWNSDGNYGLSITLGGREIKFMDLLNVYATLARYGVKKDLNSVLYIEDSGGHRLYSKKDSDGEKVLSSEVAYIISSILSDNEARRPAFGYKNNLEIPGYTVAVKTGTTDNKRDNWTFGYTPSFVVGVWVGNNDNTPMNKNLASGLSGAASIWNQVTAYLVSDDNYYSKDFNMPDGIYKLVDKDCGNKIEYFIKGKSMPSHLCIPKDKKENKKQATNNLNPV